MNDQPEKSFWHDLVGLGGWIPIVDVMRAAGLHEASIRSSQAHKVSTFLRSKGLPVFKQKDRNLNWMRKSDCPALTEHFANMISSRILRADRSARAEAFEQLDREEFDGMDLVEIFDALACDIRHTMDGLSRGAAQ